MKAPRGLVCVVALLAVASSFAAAPKKQAFGPLNFGDSPDEQKAAMEKIRASVKGHDRITAADAQKWLVINGSKFPPHLAAKHSKIIGGVHFSVEPSLSKIEFESVQLPAQEFQITVRESWEVFRDICESKFGKAISSQQMPTADMFSGQWTDLATDVWEMPGMKVTLAVRGMKFKEPRYSAVIKVEDTSAGAAVTAR